MKRIVTLILYAFCTTITFAQTAEIIEIQLLSLPENKVDFGGSDKNAAIAAIHYYENEDGKKSETFTLDSILINTVANGIKETLENSPVFEYADIPVFNIYSDTTMIDKDMQADELGIISEQTGAKIVVAVELVDINAQYIFEKSRQRPLVTNVNFVVKINAYDVETGNKEMKYTGKDNIMIPASYDEDGTYIPAPRIEDSRRITAEMIGRDFAKRIVPTWETAERLIFYDSYYDSSNSKSGKAYNAAIKEHNWSNAAKYWTEAVEESRTKSRQAQIMYNIALSCEMLENFDLAIKWLEKAKTLHTKIDENIDEYINILKQRIEDKEKLDEYFK
ncbi:MAG: tetratricopeptide repeat protein [Prevotellaceae bacterium]|jgi:tetratricopeptide (TPR) repeat protein|nr:tetratricopeptide repeat protein [Prevotellaceae bacterium]